MSTTAAFELCFHTTKIRSGRRGNFSYATGLPATADITVAKALFSLGPQKRLALLQKMVATPT
ncbi:hypothetical protein BST65_01300 [Bradyrhizobium canariense]|nr:hypothetical protein BST65_01300 [Bradyrhizobium canariense]OSI54898.1 hypothetical protein BSZ20_02165 [Bradyrhizobium canariense]OSI59889.1 hypothetical protein BSZ15_02475 [Bradyrhizobium canariense]